jgi:hypothetical protein
LLRYSPNVALDAREISSSFSAGMFLLSHEGPDYRGSSMAWLNLNTSQPKLPLVPDKGPVREIESSHCEMRRKEANAHNVW